ncbi:hypothetical protein MmiAt1_13820 [Methanimicrococcus sp. At1]|uniref:Tetrahydromethanopterin S-methyltransferase F subunit domain-containing protein n=1 Tax=Methanimicrococcus hacksteinii TaxID=3028293 RepID=A0ABU3VQW0_9EURY|nr:tetrahydromethanopterin S-methyltransferase subunit F [Methanimicrococcus sp. At1]MDV0445786.1 hypothetical protein [Methanimicrococcus sp. At1]
MKRQESRNRMAYLDELVADIGYRAQLISRSQKLDSGIMTTRAAGFAAGFLTAVLFVLIIPLTVWYFIGIL